MLFANPDFSEHKELCSSQTLTYMIFEFESLYIAMRRIRAYIAWCREESRDANDLFMRRVFVTRFFELCARDYMHITTSPMGYATEIFKSEWPLHIYMSTLLWTCRTVNIFDVTMEYRETIGTMSLRYREFSTYHTITDIWQLIDTVMFIRRRDNARRPHTNVYPGAVHLTKLTNR